VHPIAGIGGGSHFHPGAAFDGDFPGELKVGAADVFLGFLGEGYIGEGIGPAGDGDVGGEGYFPATPEGTNLAIGNAGKGGGLYFEFQEGGWLGSLGVTEWVIGASFFPNGFGAIGIVYGL